MAGQMSEGETHTRSDQLHFQWQAASAKLDYFMVGVAGALTGYLGQNMRLVPLGANSATLELISVVCLGLSMLCGFRRIEESQVIMADNSKLLYLNESAGQLISAAHEGAMILNVATGDVHSRDGALSRAGLAKDAADRVTKAIEKRVKSASRYYGQRNRLLFLGVLTLCIARVVAGYGL